MNLKLALAVGIATCVSLFSGIPSQAEMDHGKASGMAGCVQDLTPPKQIEMYLDGFHCFKSERALPAEKQHQEHATHYCAHHGDIFMCSVYDGTGQDARLVAIEYVIGNDKYQKLPESEKKFWHPHNEEVDTGLLRMPGLDPEKEKATLTFLKTTWGKTWQLWPDLANDLPVGEPVLLWSLDADKINSKTQKAKEERDAANKAAVKTSDLGESK